MDFQQAVVAAREEQDSAVPRSAKRIGETLGGLGVYRAPESLDEQMRTAGLEYGVWQCRSRLDGSTIEIAGWRLP